MDRLTAAKEMICGYENCDTCEENCPYLNQNDCPCLQEILEKLAEYEDFEEQGKLLKLPCKAGQKVYLLRKDIKTVIDGEITSFDIGEFAKDMRIFITNDNRYTNISFDKVGDIVFFTKKEAEAALKEL